MRLYSVAIFEGEGPDREAGWKTTWFPSKRAAEAFAAENDPTGTAEPEEHDLPASRKDMAAWLNSSPGQGVS